MTTTDWILWTVIALGDGYGFARFAKNIGELARRWGFFAALLFPIILTVLVVTGAMIADLKSIVLSLVVAVGFVLGMIRR